jgi:hypothetical protein
MRNSWTASKETDQLANIRQRLRNEGDILLSFSNSVRAFFICRRELSASKIIVASKQ